MIESDNIEFRRVRYSNNMEFKGVRSEGQYWGDPEFPGERNK